MRWLNDHEGGVAIIVAISMVVLFGMGAMALDVGNLFWERRQLQNGADAGAIAAAQDLASGEGSAAAEAQARTYTSENNIRDAYMERMSQPTANSVRVETITGNISGTGVLESILAGVIGTDDYFARAAATATWGALSSGSSLPVTMSYCEWQAATGVPDGGDPDDAAFPSDPVTLYLLDPQASGPDCTGPAGQQVPGGWGWLDPEGGECEAVIDEFGWVGGNTGSTSPSPANQTGCTEEFFQGLIGETVLVPIFVADNDLPGDNAEFQIIGFGAFTITGYRIRGSWTGGDVPCSNPERCFRGTFEKYVELGEDGEFGGAELGATSVILTD
jgi:Flp pilus assembly protein TadG